MGYYGDLFVRPRQAVLYALQNPSLVRSITFVLLGTVAGVLASLLFAGEIFLDALVEFLVGDISRWLLGGIVLLLMGFILKRIPLNTQNISRALSVLAQLNVYGFFMFLVLGLLLPVVTIPELLSASNQLNQGVIGPEEFDQVVLDSLSSVDNTTLLALPLIALGILFLLYSIYILFLSVQKYLDVTVFKAILGVLVIVLIQGLFVFFLNGGV